MFAHGGLFRTEGVAQRLLAAAVGAPVTVGQHRGRGRRVGDRGARRATSGAAPEQDLAAYLERRACSATPSSTTVEPDADDVAASTPTSSATAPGLAIEQAAVEATA